MSKLAKAIREKRGLYSQEEFAARIGVTRQTVAAWERSIAVPAPKQARRLNRMGIPLRLLMEGHEADPATSEAEGGRAA